MANDLTGGSSGGPWILGYRAPNASTEYTDVDGNNQSALGFRAQREYGEPPAVYSIKGSPAGGRV